MDRASKTLVLDMETKKIFDADSFFFRNLHPFLSMGTASDRYAGWIGQIYTGDRYAGRITKRTHKVGNKSFGEEVLPVDSVPEYFEHFDVLEIDYTFYRPLLEKDGESYIPTQNYHLLRKYKSFMKEGDRIILKVPQIVFAQKLYRSGRYIDNGSYLDPELFRLQFYDPAVKILGSSLDGLIFEQEYQKKKERRPAEELAEALDGFFSRSPKDTRFHVELRTESYLSPPVLEVLRNHGVGQVLSHWTWLPRLLKQFAKAENRFLNPRQCIVRLLTPIGTRYEEAYAMAHPFDKMVPGMLQADMVAETVTIMRTGIKEGISMNIIINNRAGGNAPLIAREIAHRFGQR